MSGLSERARGRAFIAAAIAVLLAAALASCETPEPPEPTEPPNIVERGRQIFFTETFGGNGRTCGTCHRAEDNFGLSPNFIATLPPGDPLFVAETIPALAKGFEAPRQMRANALILENMDGFEDLESKFVLRGVPHVLAQRTSIASRDGPHTGWSGDGAPGDRTLRSFAVGAVIQHFPRTTNRVAGIDFRLPTEEELDALEAFMLAIGRQEEIALPLPLADPIALRGQALFLDNNIARCNVCHFNAGANANPAIFGAGAGNLNFDTGVANLPDTPGAIVADPPPPRDDGRGIPGDGTFNTPPLIEAADTGPFFHNNAVATIEEAVNFYNSQAFANSPSGQAGPIRLEPTQVQAVAAFLRVLNALENIRESAALIEASLNMAYRRSDNLRLAREEMQDGIDVLAGAHLNPAAVRHLRDARRLSATPRRYDDDWREHAAEALEALRRARAALLAPPAPAPTSGSNR